MGLCKELLKTELEGEKGRGGGVVIDFYKLWLQYQVLLVRNPVVLHNTSPKNEGEVEGGGVGGLLLERGGVVARFLHISGIKI